MSDEVETELADPRVAEAIAAENTGNVWKRMWALKDRVFGARVEAAIKETPRCSYRLCRLQPGHEGFHREVDYGRKGE